MPAKAILAAALLVLSAVLSYPMFTIAGQDVNIRQLQGGQYCGKGLVSNYVIRSKADWNYMWSSVSGLTWPLPPAPAVDFDREMVIAVFRRGRTLQDSVFVEEVKKRGKGYLVKVVERSPDPKCGAAIRITFPCHVVAVPVVTGTLKYESRRELIGCGGKEGYNVPNIAGPTINIK
jgi:hypothetical protein